MKKQHTAKQIAEILNEVDAAVAAGGTVAESCRMLGIGAATYYLWRRRYGGMTLDQLKRLKELEKENSRLEKRLSGLVLDNAILKQVFLSEEGQSPTRRQRAVRYAQEELGVSERRACTVLSQLRCTQRYEARRRDDDPALIDAIKCLARKYPRYGYRRIAGLLRAEGWSVNLKRVYRLWKQEGLKASSAAKRITKDASGK